MQLHSLSISGCATLDLHSLNNEGAEGNALMTRMVEIVDEEGDNHTVNAVSGDMLKHIQAEHLFNYAKEHDLALCGGCRSFDANRICADQEFINDPEFNKDTPNPDILDRALQKCTLDDAEGILITSKIGTKDRSIPRKSCVEFGWMVGNPAKTKTESYFHAKYVPEGREKGSGEGENLGQNIFHRPASSGQYAVVANVDAFKLGRNDITLEYALDAEERLKRLKGLLVSVMNTFLRPNGAHRNTQNPHIVDFKGAIVVSTNSLPAPAVSALNGGFENQINELCTHLNKLNGDSALQAHQFTSLSEFSRVMVEIIEQVEAVQ